MDLLIKLKNNMNTKSEELSNKIIIEENKSKSETESETQISELISINKKIEVIKPIGTNIDIISNKKSEKVVDTEKVNDVVKLRRRAMRM